MVHSKRTPGRPLPQGTPASPLNTAHPHESCLTEPSLCPIPLSCLHNSLLLLKRPWSSMKPCHPLPLSGAPSACPTGDAPVQTCPFSLCWARLTSSSPWPPSPSPWLGLSVTQDVRCALSLAEPLPDATYYTKCVTFAITLNDQHPMWRVIFLSPLVQVRKLRHREAKYPAEGHRSLK